ncbi:hypothetical protein [Amycolatopsis benzoatilytica]|uniref:hypothetical protein n=1 Tax=Amycolatopsis benzoatilytica TaxID=346045 RepID=UPI00035DF076|nr:hypothetical protein [Amycolatopsis benzoatilytica]
MNDKPSAQFQAAYAELTKRPSIAVSSSRAMAGDVRQLEKADAERARKEERDFERVPTLDEVRLHPHGFRRTPWAVLQAYARATALSSQSPSRGLAHHWNCLRYLATLCSNNGKLARSEDGTDARWHVKTAQSADVGIAIGLLAAQESLARQHPGYLFQALDADLVLDAGWALRAPRPKGTEKPASDRPGYFLIGRKAGAPLRVVAADFRGLHNTAAYQRKQLYRSATRFHRLGFGNEGLQMPSIAASTTLSGPAGVEVFLLGHEADFNLAVPSHPLPTLIEPPREEVFSPFIKTVNDNGDAENRLGFHLVEERYDWFAQVLVRASAAMLLAFAGDRTSAARHLTKRQGIRVGKQDDEHDMPDARCDVKVELGGTDLVGTDHVFRFRGERVEVFSGLPEPLYAVLCKGAGSPDYETTVRDVRARWNETKAQKAWQGIIAMDEDGAVMGLRCLSDQNSVQLKPITDDKE